MTLVKCPQCGQIVDVDLSKEEIVDVDLSKEVTETA